MTGHGLTAGEARIMDLWDGGLSVDLIAIQTRQDRRYVSKVVSMYQIGGADADSRMAARATAQLAAAIQRIHPNFAELA